MSDASKALMILAILADAGLFDSGVCAALTKIAEKNGGLTPVDREALVRARDRLSDLIDQAGTKGPFFGNELGQSTRVAKA